jgi:hypothetical protein
VNFLIIDTCVWLELAEKPPLQPLLHELGYALGANVRELVVPSPVRIEFDRNRQRVSEHWVKSLQSHLKNLNSLKKILFASSDEINKVQEAGGVAIADALKVVPLNLADIDAIFKVARLWEPSDDNFRDACARSLNFNAPALVPKRSSVGDCLIWAAVLEFLDEGDVWFCSANSSDFSAAERKDQAHPDLAAEAATKKNSFRYFNNPTELVEALINEVPKVIEPPPVHLPKYFDYVPSPPNSCPKCGGKFSDTGGFMNSMYGGLTLQYICQGCGLRFDTGEAFD